MPRPHAHARSLAPRLAAAAILAVSAGTLSGCLVSGSSNQYISGSVVGKETFNKIEPGKTRAEWVEASLGAPDSKKTLDDGTEVWRWTYTKTKRSSGGVIFLVHSDDNVTTTGSTVVEIKDGIVTRAWQD